MVYLKPRHLRIRDASAVEKPAASVWDSAAYTAVLRLADALSDTSKSLGGGPQTL